MRLFVASVALSLLLPALVVGDVGAQSTECDGNFHIVHRFAFSGGGGLVGLDFSEPGDGWAVGNDYPNGARRSRPVVVRFGDTTASRVAVPRFQGRPGISGADAISPDDVWVVGSRSRTRRFPESFAMHWDGSSFSKVRVPTPGRYSYLFDVVAIASDDVWAVGGSSTRTSAQTLVIHFDGTSWERVPAPSPGRRGSILFAIDGSSSVDMWAGGYVGNGRALVLHWNGLEWERVDLEAPGEAVVYDIASTGPTDTWVVGGAVITPSDSAFATHWDGVEWESPPVPDVRGAEIFTGAYADSSGAWAVGALIRGDKLKARAALWDGSAWTNVSAEGDAETLTDVTGDGAGGVWATADRVGRRDQGAIEKACLP